MPRQSYQFVTASLKLYFLFFFKKVRKFLVEKYVKYVEPNYLEGKKKKNHSFLYFLQNLILFLNFSN